MTQLNTKLFLLANVCILFVSCARPIVKLDVGKIRGTTLRTRSITIDTFNGVPFAEKPTGANRFEKPVPIKRWTGVKDTIERKPLCMQLTKKKPNHQAHIRYSEDCLYMNIIRPHHRPDKLLPVMLVIHAGGFEYGGASNFGIRSNRGMSLLGFNVIIVAIQYRLGVYGFASNGEHDLPGNLGYFDQAEALKFVHRNIKHFGGDPDRITLYGFSAGAASTTALSVSPITRDLFNQAIAMSGSSMAIWANSNMTVESTHQLIEVLGRDANETVKQRLKRATHAEIFNATMEIETTTYIQNFGLFTPRMDGDFFPKDIPELIEESPPKPIVIGMETQESLHQAFTRNTEKSKIAIPVRKRLSFGENDLKGLIKRLISKEVYGKNTKEVQNKVFAYYESVSNSTYERDNVFYMRRYAQIASDLQFNMAILQEILYRTHFGWKVFAYMHPYTNGKRSYKHYPVKESYHGADKQYSDYMLGVDRATTADAIMERQTIKWIIKFVKTGNPSSPDLTWKPTNARSPLRFARLGPDPFMKDDFLIKRFRFWTKLAQEHNYDQVRMMPLNKTSLLNSVVI